MSKKPFYTIESGDFSKYLWHSINNAFDFGGRASQKECFVFLVAYFTFNLLNIVWALSAPMNGYTIGVKPIDVFVTSVGALLGGILGPIFPALYIIFLVGSFLVTVSLYVRRYHDSNRSGWWVLALFAVQGVSAIGFVKLAVYLGASQAALPLNPLFLVSSLILQYLIFYLALFNEPSKGKNQFGEPPVYR